MGLYGNKFLNEMNFNNGKPIKSIKELIYVIKSSAKYKKLNKQQKSSNRKYETLHKITDEERNQIENTLKEIVNRYNKDPKIKQQIKSNILNFYEKIDDIDIPNTNIKLKVELFEDDDNYLIYIICDEDQYVRVAINDITYNIAKELESKININASVDIGDGDEGCIYIQSGFDD